MKGTTGHLCKYECQDVSLVHVTSVGFVDKICGSDDPSTVGNTAIVSVKPCLEMYEFAYKV